MMELYTDSSPNGFKATIALAELGLPYRLRHVRIDQGEHRLPAFLARNPHGRIPVLVDHDTGVTVFESAAILLYLAEKTGRLLPKAPSQRWAAITWLQFHAASMGPMLGQRVHFELADGGANVAATAHFRQLCDAALATMDGRLADTPIWPATTIPSPISPALAGCISRSWSALIFPPGRMWAPGTPAWRAARPCSWALRFPRPPPALKTPG